MRREGKGASSHFFLARKKSSLGQEKEGVLVITSLKLEFHLQFPSSIAQLAQRLISSLHTAPFCVLHPGRLTKNG